MDQNHKGYLVDMIHERFADNPKVLAFGDGHTDSQMLSKSDIGVEICRNEKMQLNAGDIMMENLETLLYFLFVLGVNFYKRLFTIKMLIYQRTFQIGTVIFLFNFYSLNTSSSLFSSSLLFIYSLFINTSGYLVIGLMQIQ